MCVCVGGLGGGGGGNAEVKWEGNISRIKGAEEREDGWCCVVCCKRNGRKCQEILDRPVKKL